MKRLISVTNCLVCGRKANTSKWWTKAKSGKVYHYFRYYHSAKNIHLVPTNSTYSAPIVAGKRRVDLYAYLQDFISRGMGSKRYSFTSLKEDLERFSGQTLYNESFCRVIDKAVSSQILKKTLTGKRPVYEKESKINLDEEIRFDNYAIHYDFSEKLVKVSTFLTVTNTGRLPASSIPFYIPIGISNPIAHLHLKVATGDGEIPSSNLIVPISNALETIVSASLNRSLQRGEQEFIFIRYEIPLKNSELKLVTKTNINFLRVSMAMRDWCEIEIVRTLVDGINEVISPFQHKSIGIGSDFYLYSAFEGISKGESISVRFKNGHCISKQISSEIHSL